MSEGQLDAATFARLAPFLLNALGDSARSGLQSAAGALNHLFTSLYGRGRTRRDRLCFLVLAAPLARRVAIELAYPKDRIEAGDIAVTELEEWLVSLDASDPLAAKMIDMHWFAGLSIKDTADALDLPSQEVIRKLSCARERWNSSQQPTAKSLRPLSVTAGSY